MRFALIQRRTRNSSLNLAVLTIAYIALVLGCRPPSGGSRSSNTTTAREVSSPSANRWRYTDERDEMGRGSIKTASLKSTNSISLEFPYQGEQHATLAIREHPKFGKDVFISIEKGQLLDSDFHDRVTVRFDNDKTASFPTVRPADLSTETLFLRGTAFPTFLTKLRTAKTLRVEVPIYQAGNQVFEFNVEGFDWKR